MAITIRYFGGIKLGAGGLVRAYSKSVRDSVISAEMIEVEKGFCIRIKVSYEEQKNMDYLLREYKIINKEFLEDITYEVLIPKDKIDILSNYSYQITKEEYIEKVH